MSSHYVIASCKNLHQWAETQDYESWRMHPLRCPVCGEDQITFCNLHTSGLQDIIVKQFTVRTFSCTSTIDSQKIPQDRILSILDSEGFQFQPEYICSAREYSPFEFLNPQDKRLARFTSSYQKKTTRLQMIVPDGDPILDRIKEAVRLDNKDAKAARIAKPKKKIVTSRPGIIGENLEVGDWVAFCRCNEMLVGQILRFTDKAMTCVDLNGKQYPSVYASQSALLDKDQMIIYKLSR